MPGTILGAMPRIPTRRPVSSGARRTAVAALAAAAALALGACSNSEQPAPAEAASTHVPAGGDTAVDDPSSDDAPAGHAPTPAELDDATFTGTDVAGHPLVPNSHIEAVFEGDSISLQAGCNRLFGPYTLVDGTLTAPRLASTMMACDRPLMDQDQWLSGFLASGPHAALDGDVLTLTGPAGTPHDGTVITLTRQG